ncbi:MAG: PTS sugar transporter subunit IIC [Faecalibacterium sp.]|jgi:mannose/fructose/N-acetylgalactosamine-specific phosphotransferase system component IIC|nr:PTS sugar transporter subunit IIC [Faecalibacterium sp.]
MHVYQCILIGLIAMVGYFSMDCAGIMAYRPLVLAPLVGLVLGDLPQGILIGASLELIFLGVVMIGGSTPADAIMGSVLGTAFAITTGKGVEIALALAVPIGLLMQMLVYLLYFFRSTTMARVDAYAEAADFKKIGSLHFLHAGIMGAVYFLIAFVSLLFGADAMNTLINYIPEIIVNGLGVASQMLPAVGLALLMNMLWDKKLWVFLLFGFVLAAYLALPILAIAIIALAMGVVVISRGNASPAPVVSQGANAKKENDEEAFFE